MNYPAKHKHTVPPPVTPYPELLPLNDPNLSWERFEAFCEELISKLPGVKETHRYGGRGSRQRGIDIFADLENGERWAFQCRQWKKFKKADATTAIQNTTYRADRFILTLSCQATSWVRDAVDSQDSWDAWDVGDISRKVREMELHPAARLVETHFGAQWRREFLGLQGQSPFVAPPDFFGPFLNESALFNHAWQLVGRTDYVQRTHEFVQSRQRNVAILIGRGGIGKTKILHAFAETFDDVHEGTSLWFMAEGVPVTQDGADYLPYQRCVVVVDDAHRRDDLPALLALLRHRPDSNKLILSCRPQGIDYLRSLLTQGGFDTREVVELPEVKELSHREVTELGRQALGLEFEGLAEKLAAVTWDCPLVTVVGGQLLAQRAIAPELLERDDEFRRTVLDRFKDIVVGKVSDRIDSKLCRSLLNLIAAVQPIRLDNSKLMEFAAKFLGIDGPSFLLSLGLLEEAGVLLRRGRTLRIVPDVLADHILHQVSVMPQGQKTGYADLVFHEFVSICPSEVLRNLSELDWRLRWSDGHAPDLLSGIWQSIEREFQVASHSERIRILLILEKVAMFQPERMLELVEHAIRHPATKPEDPKLSNVYEFTHDDVLPKLPTLLRRISYTIDFLPQCCNLLWDLGRDDGRILNSNPDHAIRVLQDMASYDPGKPLVVNREILEVIERLAEHPESHNHVYSPLDIIDPMLEKTGLSTHSEGHQLAHSSFILKKESIKPVRERCVSLVVRCMFSNDLKVSLRAVKSLESALSEPVGSFDHEVTAKNREQWRSEQLEILEHIASLARRSIEPVALLRIREVLWWHHNYSRSEDVRHKADEIVLAFPETFELRLTRALMGPYCRSERLPKGGGDEIDYGALHNRILETQRELAEEFLDHSQDPRCAFETLRERIQCLEAARVEYSPHEFLSVFGKADPEFAAGLCDVIVDDPNGVVAPYIHAFLSNVLAWNSNTARSIGQRILKRDESILCRGLALSYQSMDWADKAFSSEDVQIIKCLITHEDMEVKRLAIGSLGALAKARTREAIDLVKSVEFGDSSLLAIEVCRLFGGWWNVPFSELTADDLLELLSKLEDVEDIDQWDINAFLVKASLYDARAVVRLLLTRIRKGGKKGSRFSALPVLGFRQPLKGLANSPNQVDILRDIRDTVLEPGSLVKWWVPKLFNEVSSGFDSCNSFMVLEEWINSGDVVKIEHAALLVSTAQPSFVFKNVPFTANLLERAHSAGHESYERVCGSLWSSSFSGTFSRTPGQPSQRHMTMKEKSLTLAAQFEIGSPTYKFYVSLAEDAEARMENDLLRDEEEYN